MDLAQFLGALEHVRKQGDGYLARCPAHNDHHPSLSISEGEDGRVLLHCWAGCETARVLAAMGLSWSDLYAPRPGSRGGWWR